MTSGSGRASSLAAPPLPSKALQLPWPKGIKIEATGQNIITVGDGNQVNAKYADAAGALVELKQALLQTDAVTEGQKLDAVADIDTIESQLAKAEPSRPVFGAPGTE